MKGPKVQNNGDDTQTPDVLPMQMTEGSDSTEGSRPDFVPTKDLDALRSVKDREVAQERKQRQELERQLTELKQQMGIEVSRRQLAESQASEAQATVNLRNFARQLAQSKYGVWGPDVQKAAEEKFLAAEDRNHLIALEHEFATAELPTLVKQTESVERRKERERRTLDETVGLTVSRIEGSTLTSGKGDDLTQVGNYLTKARRSQTWKSSDEGAAALREAREVLGRHGYPTAQIRDWAHVANALSSLRLTGAVGTDETKRVTQI